MAIVITAELQEKYAAYCFERIRKGYKIIPFNQWYEKVEVKNGYKCNNQW